MFQFLKSLFAAKAPAAPALPDLTPASLASEAALAQVLATWLRAQPGIAAVEQRPDALGLRFADKTEQTLFLHNALTALRARSGPEQAEYLRNLLVSPVAMFNAKGGRILPVLKPGDYIDTVKGQLAAVQGAALQASGVDLGLPLHSPIAPGLCAVYAQDTPEMMHMLTEPDLARLGLAQSDLAEIARQQLIDHLNAQGFKRHERGGGRLHQWQVDGNYEASLAFLPKLWQAEAKAFGAPPAVAFLSRDTVLAVSSADAAAMDQLSDMAVKAQAELAYFISPHLYTPTESGGWRLLRRNGEAAGQPIQ